MSHAGTALLLRTAEKTGLVRALPEAPASWRTPMARHDPGKIILDLAITLALGGDCLADLAGTLQPVASDPTVSRLITTLAADALAALTAINTARAAELSPAGWCTSPAGSWTRRR